MLEAYLLRTVRVEAGGSEAAIPPTGTLVAAFAPHSGWIESIVIDACFARAGRAWPVWLTKGENRALPGILRGDRAICTDRENPEPSAVRAVYALLRQPDAALGTAIEGTTTGNPNDPEDLLTLGEFKTGPARFAIGAQVPILPVILLGSDQVVPCLEQVWHTQGTVRAFQAIQQLMVHPQPIEIRFLPLYRDHLGQGCPLQGKRLREQAILHTGKLGQILVAQILALRPDYPLGEVNPTCLDGFCAPLPIEI
jgi:1-acyl-sn-glycerol-3-phosphate acyltransferase